MSTVEMMHADSQKVNAGLSRALNQLERSYDFFNSRLWFEPQRAKLQRPVISIQTAGQRNAIAWFRPDTWNLTGTCERLPEINLCAEHLADGVYEIIDSLLHEMVHFSNWTRKIRDCSSNQYHNKKFLWECSRIGLKCVRGKRRWAYTELSDRLKNLADELALDTEAFNVFRFQNDISPARRPPKLIKWVCNCGHVNSVWRATLSELHATCNVCNTSFRPA